MTRLGKFWTAGIAYVALAIGAGLSIMYNLLQTMFVRGPLFGWPDFITAVAMPGLVVLMVELFVSRMWIGRPWHVQAVRVLATVVIGGVAMRASWTHGHDWMLGHGHTPDVAIMWPLAIDLLAILATALILAGRRGHVANGHDGHDGHDGHLATVDALATAMANGTAVWSQDGQDMASGHWPDGQPARLATGHDGHLASGQCDPVATQPLPDAEDWERELAKWADGMDMAIGQAGQELACEAEQFVAMAGDPLPQRTAAPVPVAAGIPAEARKLLLAWDPALISSRELDVQLAAQFGKSTRTVRRWRHVVLNVSSGTPDEER